MWELGVIRSIGVRKDELIRLCVYESFVVTTSAVIVGVTVGIIVAVTLTLQFNIFIELPFRFVVRVLSYLVPLFDFLPDGWWRTDNCICGSVHSSEESEQRVHREYSEGLGGHVMSLILIRMIIKGWQIKSLELTIVL